MTCEVHLCLVMTTLQEADFGNANLLGVDLSQVDLEEEIF